MGANRLQRWWLAGCVVAGLIANWVGGFSIAVTAVFAVICLTGVALIRDDGDRPPAPVADDALPGTDDAQDGWAEDVGEGEPYPEDSEQRSEQKTSAEERSPG